MNTFKNLSYLLFAGLFFIACSGPIGNQTGHEYMPDMAHSVAIEANAYDDYWANSWDKESVISRKKTSIPGLPVQGTIPRGYTGIAMAGNSELAMMSLLNGESSNNAIRTPVNGNVPYYYKDTEDERLRAIKDITKNPFPITKAGLEKGKELYLIYCGICHGEKADGAGYLVRDDGGKYPAQPAILVSDDFINSSEGRYYHAIQYGRNAMGGYTDKLSYEERWQVIHYIRSLQADAKSLKYNDTENTLNSNAIPQAKIVKAAKVSTEVAVEKSSEASSNIKKSETH
jgi:hypothetical protein